MHVLAANNSHHHLADTIKVAAWALAAVVLATTGVGIATISAWLIPVGWSLVSLAAAIIATPVLHAAAQGNADYPEGLSA